MIPCDGSLPRLDTRHEIRDQLAAGATSDEIVGFFSSRYGDRVLGDLPHSGFNLLLCGWRWASVLLTTVIGGVALMRLRRPSAVTPTIVGAASGPRFDGQSAEA